ncbi:MAG TPA: hypothetical protein VII43_04600 [Opitutaceae bacterium]
MVIQKDVAGETQSWTGIGPLLYSEPVPGPDAGHAEGLRPFYGRLTIGETDRTLILYPLFYLRQYPDHYKWSILELINGEGVDSNTTKAGGPLDKHFDVWPFYFSHETGDPVDSYHALLPIYGNMKYRLGFDRLFWAPFPLYVETVKRDTTVTYTPWPIVRFIRGAQNGFAIWPLFGSSEGPGPAKHFFCLWPLIWNNTLEPALNAPDGSAPGTEVGFLPFYTLETAPGYVSVNYAWPFFGHTERTIPYRYSEQRYFWPFFVQGRGDDRLVDRWGPFYTHSNIKGTDSTWVGWPFWHQTSFADDDISQTKTQFFYFVYWSLDEKSVSRPNAPHAYKRHLWPLLSIWDNGAGSRQLQVPSPLEVFFPDNPEMRETWTPIFSLYRYDHRPTGETRTSLLWNAVTWRRDITGRLSEFHLGPLFGMHRKPSGESWSIFGFDFGTKENHGRLATR